jgi:integrase
MGNKKKTPPKAKEPIKLRLKKLANGNQSIYLDYYTAGKRQYEFLKLYLIPEHTAADKEANRQTMATANAVKAQRIVELQNSAHGFKLINLKQKARLTDYLQKLADEKKGVETIGQHRSYSALIRHIKLFRGEDTTFRQVTKEYCKDFMGYLDTVENANYKMGRSETYTSGLLSTNTKYSYVKLLNVALNRAIEESILTTNPLSQLPKYERPKRQLLNREYLTIDEVKQLVKTPCIKPLVKNSFLFSCFSGLRYSDVKSLTWGQIQTDNEGQKVIRYTQKKTDKPEYLQLSGEACKFLPERRSDARDNDIIYPLVNNGYTNETLKSWILAAGITKRVTFHVGRHTNATLLLSLGVPIETVSKLLGHADIQTTQIYAKVIDKNKREAVSKLDGLTD